jgi:pheromone shutdown-related protein TraB
VDESVEPTAETHSGDVHVVETADRKFILVGTAHVSRESAELVREVIERERPDRVCVELDAQRFEALSRKNQWEKLDLKQVIRQKRLPTLIVNLLLASYQKRIGGKLGVMPGTELLEAVRAAEDNEIPYSLCDRNIRITLLRAWRSMSIWQKNKLLSALLLGVFGEVEISEEDIQKLRERDVLSEMMGELSRVMPSLKTVLIDERDAYLAEKIRAAEGRTVVAVVGAGHVEGIRERLETHGPPADLEEIESIPKVFPVAKWVGWAIPVVILGSLGLIAATKGGAVAGQNLVFWILANGIPSSIGAVLALAHPVTVLVAFLAAPITSLTPVIGAGYVTAFVQAYVRPPLVRDFETISDDVAHFGRWWSNRLLKVFLAFILPSLGSILGTYVGAYEILSNLF